MSIDLNLSVQTARTNYRKTWFVGRSQELESVHKLLTQAYDRKIERPLLELYAPPYLGKTWLLRRIGDEYTIDSATLEEFPKRKTFSVYLDLTQLVGWNNREYWWYHYFLRSLVANIPESVGTLSAELAAFKGPIPEIPLNTEQQKATLDAFHKWIQSILPEWLPVFLLDSTEQADPLLLNWLEREILVPLVQTSSLLIIVAGRRPLYWQEPETRFRVTTQELEPLADEDDIWADQPIGEEHGSLIKIPRLIHERYTLGHPGMAAELYKELRAHQVVISKETLRTAEEEKRIIAPSFTRVANTALLLGVPHKLHPLIESVAVLRVFNAASLQKFASKFAPENHYHSMESVFFRKSIREMIAANVVKWTASLSDYSVLPIVRRVMCRSILLRDPVSFRLRHQMAYDIFSIRLEADPNTAPWNVPEILYHRAMLADFDRQTPVQVAVKQELDSLMAKPYFTHVYKTADDLVNRLNNREDKDLGELHFEFIKLVGTGLLTEIIHRLEDYAQTLEHD